MTQRLTFIILIITASLSACHKDKVSQPVRHPAAGVDTLMRADFPIHAGNTWTYQRDDALQHTTDTFTISVGDPVTYQGIAAYLWIQTTRLRSDTGYIGVTGDMILFYQDTNMILPSNIPAFETRSTAPFEWLAFPMVDGINGTTAMAGGSDDFRDSLLGQLSVNSITYSKVMEYHRNVRDVEDFIFGEEWVDLSPGVGIVRFRLSRATPIAPRVYTLTLLSYSVH